MIHDMHRHRSGHGRRKTRHSRDKTGSWPKGFKKYQDFVDDQIRAGKTREQATRLWHKAKKNKTANKAYAVKSAAKRRKTYSGHKPVVKRNVKKGKKMATNRPLPPEILALARALKEAGSSPSEAKKSSIQRSLEAAARAMKDEGKDYKPRYRLLHWPSDGTVAPPTPTKASARRGEASRTTSRPARRCPAGLA